MSSRASASGPHCHPGGSLGLAMGLLLIGGAACQGTLDGTGRAAEDSAGAGAFVGTGGAASGSGGAGGMMVGAGGGAGSAATGPAYFGAPSLRRLSTTEYASSVRDLFGNDGLPLPELEADTRLNGLTAIGGTNLALSPRATELYEQAAYLLAEGALADAAVRDAFVGCDPAQAACVEDFLARFGLRAFRRPLTDVELTRFAGVATRGASELGDAWEGLEYAVAGILQSPYFLYRVELGTAQADGTRVLDEYELASRLSYTLWGTAPDGALLDAAALSGVASALGDHATRLVESPRATAAVERFYGEYLGLSDLSTLAKLTDLFPAFTESLKQAMREETMRAAAESSFTSDADFRSLFTTRSTYVNAELAELYGIPAPAAEGFSRVELPADGMRQGLLGNASLLSLYAHESSTSPTLRGKFVREVLLCQGVPAPPANVDTTLPEPGPDTQTTRDRFARHATEEVCSGCHALMDPIGLGLEHFDAIGRYRDAENGVAIDATGQVDTGDPATAFNGPVELGAILSQHPRLPTCMVRTLYRHATGSLEQPPVEPVLSDLDASFATSGYRFRQLLLAMTGHAAFRVVGALD